MNISIPRLLPLIIISYFTAGLFTAILVLKNDKISKGFPIELTATKLSSEENLGDWITAIIYWPIVLPTKFWG